MKSKHSARLYVTSASIVAIMILLSLTGTFLRASQAALALDSVTGAIWTTDHRGEQVNGNLYGSAQKVYLCGGPHKEGSAGLPDGRYYFQVTDPPGKTLLSTDDPWERRFEVKNGYIFSIDDGTHKWKNDTTRGYGIVVQLCPFFHTPKTGGVYKVWVTRVDHYVEGQGCYGFIPSLSKTDNFKVGAKLGEVHKYFELWMTDGISEPPDVEFHVNYTLDGDGNASTLDPVDPWTEGQLRWNRVENGYEVFRYETSFAPGTYIYWKFIVSNSFTLISDVYGPERIDQEGMVNKETLFMVNGMKFDYRDLSGLGGWTIELYKDGVRIASTQTRDGDGYYELMGIGSGDFMICEIMKDDEGWANATPACYEFTVDDSNGGDRTFDFYNYKMLRITDTSENRCELSSFHLVFTPSNEDSEMYKLSSTNPGSFYTNVVKYGVPRTNVTIEIYLPPDQENGVWFDSPNFIVHHTYIGSTPVVDAHVYAGRLDPSESACGSEWVPDGEEISNLFEITVTPDGKNVTVEGIMPETGEVFVTVHIDYQITASVTWDMILMFRDFEYTFSDMVYFSAQGVRMRFPTY